MRNHYQLQLLVALLALPAAISWAQDDGQPPIDAAIMQKWKTAAAPGANHKLLEKFVGQWHTTARYWPRGADSKPMTSTGTARFRVMFDGRFLAQTAQGQMLGTKFQGLGLMGYDTLKRKYTMMWIDAASTAMHTAEGNLDETGNVLSLFGQMDDPATGQRGQQVKYVWRIESSDRLVFELHDLTKQSNLAEVVYIRQGSR